MPDMSDLDVTLVTDLHHEPYSHTAGTYLNHRSRGELVGRGVAMSLLLDRVPVVHMALRGCKVTSALKGLKLGAWHTAGMPTVWPLLTVSVGM